MLKNPMLLRRSLSVNVVVAGAADGGLSSHRTGGGFVAGGSVALSWVSWFDSFSVSSLDFVELVSPVCSVGISLGSGLGSSRGLSEVGTAERLALGSVLPKPPFFWWGTVLITALSPESLRAQRSAAQSCHLFGYQILIVNCSLTKLLLHRGNQDQSHQPQHLFDV